MGSGGVGTIAAVVLEKSGRARVTVVLRSSYEVVNEKGFDIESVDHGDLMGWKPERGELRFLLHFETFFFGKGRVTGLSFGMRR